MTTNEIIKNLITDRENTLSVRHIQVTKDSNSLSNPKISVGTLPFYDWDKVKEMTYVITYGRYLNCEMLVYKTLRNDKDFVEVKGQQKAIETLTKIINSI